MAQCLLGTSIHAAPGIIFNYLWDGGVACDKPEKEAVGFCIQYMNLCHAPVDPWLLSAAPILTGGLRRRGRACIPWWGCGGVGGVCFPLLHTESGHQELPSEPLHFVLVHICNLSASPSLGKGSLK